MDVCSGRDKLLRNPELSVRYCPTSSDDEQWSGRADLQKHHRLLQVAICSSRKIANEEGMSAFFKGNMSNMIRSVSSSLVLVLFDEFKTVYMKNSKTH